MRKSVLDEVRDEREEQDKRWGGSGHDDEHTSFDWCALIVRHLGRAVEHHPAKSEQWNPAAFRRGMIRVAALAVAAVEWFDRKFEAGR